VRNQVSETQLLYVRDLCGAVFLSYHAMYHKQQLRAMFSVVAVFAALASVANSLPRLLSSIGLDLLKQAITFIPPSAVKVAISSASAYQQYWYANLSEEEKKSRRPYIYADLFRSLMDENTYKNIVNIRPEAGQLAARYMFDEFMNDVVHCLRTLNLSTEVTNSIVDDSDEVSILFDAIFC
jgi:hypothetical protein